MYDFETMDKRYVIFGNIFLLANRLQAVMDQSTRDLTARQWFVIMMLGSFDDPPTLGQLADACDCSHQNIRQIVKKLEAKGFVKTEEDARDRRAMRIIATGACDRWERENHAFTTGFVDRMFSRLTEDEIVVMKAAQHKLNEELNRMKEEIR